MWENVNTSSDRKINRTEEQKNRRTEEQKNRRTEEQKNFIAYIYNLHEWVLENLP